MRQAQSTGESGVLGYGLGSDGGARRWTPTDGTMGRPAVPGPMAQPQASLHLRAVSSSLHRFFMRTAPLLLWVTQ